MKTFSGPKKKKRFCELYPVTDTEDSVQDFQHANLSIRQRAKFYKVKKTPEAITRAQSISRREEPQQEARIPSWRRAIGGRVHTNWTRS